MAAAAIGVTNLPETDPVDSTASRPSVFLSYASADRAAARRLRDALPKYGLDVWYDESELGGGEAWDQKIRRQIRECDYFMALISAQTEARHEGYFRREWRFAVERTLDMADDHLFLLPIVIDETEQAGARVPEKFMMVQWLRVPGGAPTRALETLCRRIAGGNPADPASSHKAASAPPPAAPPPADSLVLPFPREEPGQRLRFFAEIAIWATRSAWALFTRFPRWMRIVGYCWFVFFLVSQCDSAKHRTADDPTPQNIEKLQVIAKGFQSGPDKNDLTKLGSAIAAEFSEDEDKATDADHSPLLAIAFTAPPGDAAAQNLATTSFVMAYGLAAIANSDKVGLAKDPAVKPDLTTALELGRAKHATYVLYGRIATVDAAARLTVEIAKVADGSVVWSTSHDTAGLAPTRVAAEIVAHLPSL
jgi:hypothetical protein